uniref:Putative RNA-dependent RNA polymerase n=1 Tax=Grapevine associated partitivirus-1 TaxID=908835 RepID=E7BMW6_9VIRU|nr:putative RNA-dependent RNA polymerase [Grapevine associated partitivirus-1]
MLPKIRDYFHEKLKRLLFDHKIFSSQHEDPEQTAARHASSDIERIYKSIHNYAPHPDVIHDYEAQYQHIHDTLVTKQSLSGFNAEFYRLRTDPVPDNRIPPSGITLLPFEYKSMNTVTATLEVPESGFHIHPKIERLVRSRYPQYLTFVRKYTRPLGTTDATVADFFKPQTPSAPVEPERISHIMTHVMKKMAITPYRPLHFVDTQYDKRPLHTGTGYFNRRSIVQNVHAMFSYPKEYESKPSSKGYYINAFLESARSLVHWIKSTGTPFRHAPSNLADSLRTFFLQRPTMLFTRNHISDRDGNLKQRPVYAVDDLFLTIESMLTFPAHVIARKLECCIMYGFETIRGSNAALDTIAQSYKSFFTIDWSGFDQRLPWVIAVLFFTEFIPRLLVINHGYAPTYEYPSYPDLTTTDMVSRLNNLLTFLSTWYFNMVYVTADGYSYTRHLAGVPSGMLNTQFLGSFGNLVLITDGLIEYGFTDHEIDNLLLFIMGDDNSGFTHWSIARLESFIQWFETYTLHRYGMVLSKTKSVITVLRQRIETLGYQCNFGHPRRPIGKLVAQLCYPERGPRPKYMSARAVGMAWASCAQDKTFHDFCRDVYYEFLDEREEIDETTYGMLQSYLPGYLRIDESVRQTINFNEFPSLEHVFSTVRKWKGPLSYQPKWDLAHFVYQPDVIPPNSQTLHEYWQLHNYKMPILYNLF